LGQWPSRDGIADHLRHDITASSCDRAYGSGDERNELALWIPITDGVF
jgi:hypothetical protein